jgi:hypothetical protein
VKTDAIKNIVIGALAGIVITLIIVMLIPKRQDPVSYPQTEKGDKTKAVSPYQANQVKNTIIKNYKGIKTCFMEYSALKPAVKEGTMRMDFEIDGDGRVIKAGVIHDPFNNEVFRNCMIDTVKKIEFPRPNIPAPVYIDHKFIFNDKDSEKRKRNKK